ncbi:hypothetical protein NC653_001172 [Populus alba x Populus x berolinensis]|uniref:Uncharacterized protein n=1 Tax=Populus alba x Populus x berolinensis TaxID=444605 RepID=A0AAD6WG68_9ROSI|nr:hypothetical protein NC653_001172 [Populus alba x Populus x berolinensis]
MRREDRGWSYIIMDVHYLVVITEQQENPCTQVALLVSPSIFNPQGRSRVEVIFGNSSRHLKFELSDPLLDMRFRRSA